MADESTDTQKPSGISQHRQLIIWLGALILGSLLGLIDSDIVRGTAGVTATIFTRLFQLLAVPTIALAVITSISSFGRQKEAGRIFGRTITYTVLTTFAAAVLGLGLYLVVSPGLLQTGATDASVNALPEGLQDVSYADNLLSAVPNNIVRPFLDGNVLSVLIIALAVGIALTRMADTEGKRSLTNCLQGLQELLFTLIRALVWALPLGIVAFAAQFVDQLVSGTMSADSLGRYVFVVLLGNVLQIFVVLPLFLRARGINAFAHLRAMSKALLMALFSKSSAATLPLTMESAEQRANISPRVSRFVLPICTTVNMNGCAAFILITTLFIMQNSGIELSLTNVIPTLLISIIAAVGNAGVPMGCYFLTFSLTTGMSESAYIMGLILPVYTLLDMVETAENVWSDSCVAAMVDKDFREKEA